MMNVGTKYIKAHDVLQIRVYMYDTHTHTHIIIIIILAGNTRSSTQ